MSPCRRRTHTASSSWCETCAAAAVVSDDISMLEWVAQLLGRRVDAIRVERERQEQSVREQEIRRLASEAELEKRCGRRSILTFSSMH